MSGPGWIGEPAKDAAGPELCASGQTLHPRACVWLYVDALLQRYRPRESRVGRIPINQPAAFSSESVFRDRYPRWRSGTVTCSPLRTASGCSASGDGDEDGRRGVVLGIRVGPCALWQWKGAEGERSRFTSVWRLLISLKAAGCTCGWLQGGEGPPSLPGLGMAGRALCDHGGLALPAAAGPPLLFSTGCPGGQAPCARGKQRESPGPEERPPSLPVQRSNGGGKHRGHCRAGLCDSQPVPGAVPAGGTPQ